MSQQTPPAKLSDKEAEKAAEERKAKLAAAMQPKPPEPTLSEDENNPPPPPPVEAPVEAPLAFKIMRRQTVSINGSVVTFKENEKVSNPTVIKALKEANIDMVPIHATWRNCPSCSHRFVDEV